MKYSIQINLSNTVDLLDISQFSGCCIFTQIKIQYYLISFMGLFNHFNPLFYFLTLSLSWFLLLFVAFPVL